VHGLPQWSDQPRGRLVPNRPFCSFANNDLDWEQKMAGTGFVLGFICRIERDETIGGCREPALLHFTSGGAAIIGDSDELMFRRSITVKCYDGTDVNPSRAGT